MQYEIIGLAGTAFVVICFLFDDQKKIRVFDAIGASLFIVYGILIGSVSNVTLNSILLCIQCAKLIKMKRDNNGKTEKGNRQK